MLLYNFLLTRIGVLPSRVLRLLLVRFNRLMVHLLSQGLDDLRLLLLFHMIIGILSALWSKVRLWLRLLRDVNFNHIWNPMVLTRIARSWRQASGLVIVLSSHQPISMNSTSLLGSDILEITWNRLIGMSLKLPFFVLIFVHQFVPILLRCSSLLLDFRLSFRIQI